MKKLLIILLLTAFVNPHSFSQQTFPYTFHWGDIISNGGTVSATYQPYDLHAGNFSGSERRTYCELNAFRNVLSTYSLRRMTINGVMLTLYHNPNLGHWGSNSAFIRRATSPLIMGNINAFPTNTTINQLTLPQSSFPNQDYTNLAITNLFTDMIREFPNSNGFTINPANMSSTNWLSFQGPGPSTTYQNIPQIGINWQWNDCQPSYGEHPDMIHNRNARFDTWNPNGADCISDELEALTWTMNLGTSWGIIRSALDFDLSYLINNPALINVTDARLYLYAHPNPLNGNHTSAHAGANTSVLQRITNNWACPGASWFNQPVTTTLNQATLRQSTSGFQNYVVDVTAMVTDAITNPTAYFGFLLRLANENVGNSRTDYRSMIFASGNHTNFHLRPALVICANWWTRGINVEELTSINKTDIVYEKQKIIPGVYEKEEPYDLHQIEDSSLISPTDKFIGNIDVYPNPTTGVVLVTMPEVKTGGNIISVEIINTNGILVKSFINTKNPGNKLSVDVSDLKTGVYILQLKNSGNIYRQKIIKH